MIDVTYVEPRANYTLFLRFSNGDQGTLAVAEHLKFVGYFAPLASPEFFEEVYLEHGTVRWPDEIDLDPIVVHAWTMDVPLKLAGDNDAAEPLAPIYHLHEYAEDLGVTDLAQNLDHYLSGHDTQSDG